MIYVDAHCDTISRLMEVGQELDKNHCHVDIDRMSKAGSYVQFFAAFIDPAYGQAYAMRRAVQIIDKYYEQIGKFSHSIQACTNHADIEAAIKAGKIGALLSIEGGDALQGELSALRVFYRIGVRSICLTWNHRNEIADGVGDAASGGGLTPFGQKVIEEMNSLGMLIDLSHISEKGFWDVLESTRAPIIVSHSNAKKICGHRRNLTDEQLLAVRKNGGVVGINLYPWFLTGSETASMKDVISHIEHMSSILGPEHIGIGADFDGIECTPLDMAGVEAMPKLVQELMKLNYGQAHIEGLMGKNFLRVIKEVLG